MIDYIKQLKEDPLVYYIYQVGLSIYNIPEDSYSYIVIIDPEFKNGKTTVDNYTFTFYNINYWFDKVLTNDIDTWICSCLNKKFIIKEHVKILIKPNILRLRQQALGSWRNESLTYDGYHSYKHKLFHNLCVVKLINQILENHKIVNFGELTRDYEKLNSVDDIKTLGEIYHQILADAETLTHKLTDDWYHQYLINKANE